MLDKELYDSWKSIMELYIQNREHERMILTDEENKVTKTKKYAELSASEKIQAVCDRRQPISFFKTKDLDTYDSNCDDILNAKAVLMAIISNYGSDVISETKNVELENSVAKLISKNKRLCKENNHGKQVFKDQFDSIKKTRVCTKEHSDSLIDKLNLKSAENKDLKGMFKLDLDPLASKLMQNREAHIDYLKYTQEEADIFWGIVEQAKAKQPLDIALDFACKHAQRIQELLVFVQDTCPNASKLSAKKVAIIPKTKIKKVRFAEPLTSLSNIKHVESSITSDSNTHVLSPTGLKCFTSNYRSKRTCNKKNDRMLQTPIRNIKNKVEAQPRKVNKKNHVVECLIPLEWIFLKLVKV
nr:hypothetical protein [Tanacetum cinerariifolium]